MSDSVESYEDKGAEVSEVLQQENLIILPSNSNGMDEIYCAQDNYDLEKLRRSYEFLVKAINLGYVVNGVFSLECQVELHNKLYPTGERYEPISVTKFGRLNSKGKNIDCLVARNGHHRMWVMKHLGINLEAEIYSNVGNLGVIRDMDQLNFFIAQRDQSLGRNGTKVIRNRAMQRKVKSELVVFES